MQLFYSLLLLIFAFPVAILGPSGTGGGGGTGPFLDACTGSGNLPHPPWTAVDGQMTYQSFSGTPGCYDSVHSHAGEIFDGHTYAPAQYIQAQEIIGNASGLSIRLDASQNGYAWWPDVNPTSIFRLVGGGFAGYITMTTNCPAINVGDTIRLTVDSAYTFTCTNETTSTSGTGTDGSSLYATGFPGIRTVTGSPITNIQAN